MSRVPLWYRPAGWPSLPASTNPARKIDKSTCTQFCSENVNAKMAADIAVAAAVATGVVVVEDWKGNCWSSMWSLGSGCDCSRQP